MNTMNQFLLAYDHGQDRLIVQREFGADLDAAMTAYSELEQQYRDSALVDIVLVGSDSIETVQVTHSNYFTGMARAAVTRLLHEPA